MGVTLSGPPGSGSGPGGSGLVRAVASCEAGSRMLPVLSGGPGSVRLEELPRAGVASRFHPVKLDSFVGLVEWCVGVV